MDSFPDQVIFTFKQLRSKVDDPTQSWQLLLRVVAGFTVLVDGKNFYTEVEFPVVEFAMQVAKWLQEGDDFFYISMESAEEPLLAFYRQVDGKFLVFSPHQEYEEKRHIEKEELFNAASSFVQELKSRAMSELDLNIEEIL